MSHKKLILIADDEVAIHDSLRLYLQREGDEVYSVFRGTDVMEAFQRMRPDLVILDIMMPGIDGFEFVADVRSVNKHIPILLMTALDDMSAKRKGFGAGIDDYMEKPIDVDELLLRIEALLRRAHAGNRSLQLFYAVNDFIIFHLIAHSFIPTLP